MTGIAVRNRKRIASMAFTGAAAAAVVGMNITPAAATAGTWRITPGNGNFFSAHNVSAALLSANGIALYCAPGTVSISGQVSGDGKQGPAQLDTITKANFGVNDSWPCKLFGSAYSARIKMGAGPYHLNGKSYNPASRVASGSITNISASINTKPTDAMSCHLTATNVGMGSPLPVSFHDGSHELVINPASTTGALRIKSVSGSATFCTNLYHPGDNMFLPAAVFSAHAKGSSSPLSVTYS